MGKICLLGEFVGHSAKEGLTSFTTQVVATLVLLGVGRFFLRFLQHLHVLWCELGPV